MPQAIQKIGNYELIKILGEGGMGVVYLAEHPEIGRRVAIKLLRSTSGERDNSTRRFKDEARLLVKLKHPNIVETSDYGRTPDGQLYYVMELLEGRHLRRLLTDDGPMTPGAALSYLEQICSALSAAHRIGVVHRDLKPDNIFVVEVEGTPRVKLLDFGLARLWQTLGDTSMTRTGDLLGSPVTISPEQAAGLSKGVNRRSDLYSLGVILYWMLAGEPPFISKQPGRLISMHLNTPAPDLHEEVPEVSPLVAAVVTRCMEKKPEDRPASADNLLRGYVRALEGLDPWPQGEKEAGATAVGYVNPAVDGDAKPDEGGEGEPGTSPAGGAKTLPVAWSKSIGDTLLRLVSPPRLWIWSPVVLALAAASFVLYKLPGEQGASGVSPPDAAEARAPDAAPVQVDLEVILPDTSAAHSPDAALPAPPPKVAQPKARPAKPRPKPRPKKPRPAPRQQILGEGVLDEF